MTEPKPMPPASAEWLLQRARDLLTDAVIQAQEVGSKRPGMELVDYQGELVALYAGALYTLGQLIGVQWPEEVSP